MSRSEAQSDALSPAQLRALSVIQEFTRRGGSPTLRELGAALGVRAVSAVRRRILQLEAQGLVCYERTPGNRQLAARTLRLTARGLAMLEQYARLQASHILHGERGLLLDRAAQATARRAGVPLDAFATRMWGQRMLVAFPDRATRDAWAAIVLEALDRGGAR